MKSDDAVKFVWKFKSQSVNLNSEQFHLFTCAQHQQAAEEDMAMRFFSVGLMVWQQRHEKKALRISLYAKQPNRIRAYNHDERFKRLGRIRREKEKWFRITIWIRQTNVNAGKKKINEPKLPPKKGADRETEREREKPNEDVIISMGERRGGGGKTATERHKATKSKVGKVCEGDKTKKKWAATKKNINQPKDEKINVDLNANHISDIYQPILAICVYSRPSCYQSESNRYTESSISTINAIFFERFMHICTDTNH